MPRLVHPSCRCLPYRRGSSWFLVTTMILCGADLAAALEGASRTMSPSGRLYSAAKSKLREEVTGGFISPRDQGGKLNLADLVFLLAPRPGRQDQTLHLLLIASHSALHISDEADRSITRPILANCPITPALITSTALPFRCNPHSGGDCQGCRTEALDPDDGLGL